MKKTVCALLILTCALPCFAVPSPLGRSADGWLDLGLNYTLTLPDFRHNGGLHINGADRANWGLGISLIVGERLLECTFNFLYHFNPSEGSPVSFPVYVKAGWINTGLGVVVEAGVKWFFWELEAPSGDHVYFTGELLGGLHVIALPLFDVFALRKDDPPFIPTLALNLTFACPPPESSGYWVTY